MYGSRSILNFLPTPGGGLLRFGCWSPDRPVSRGTILLLGGRTEFIEKYTETIAELTAREYHVCSFDWRGQGLSSRCLNDPHKGHVDTFDTYLGDMAWIVENRVIPTMQAPFIVMAHSMGGHLALRFMCDHPTRFAKAILTAPMIDINLSAGLKKWIRRLTALIVNLGGGRWYTIGSGKNTWRQLRFSANRLTSDPQRFWRTQALLAKQPALAVGGATYMWLKAAFDSIAALKEHRNRARIDTPILIVRAGKDQIVSRQAQQNMCARLPRCRMITIPGSRHEILMEHDRYRASFWEAFDAFMLDV